MDPQPQVPAYSVEAVVLLANGVEFLEELDPDPDLPLQETLRGSHNNVLDLLVFELLDLLPYPLCLARVGGFTIRC